MIIYNSQKEFVGIDAEYLKLLGYESLEEMLQNCTDFADLFLKKPGYIHNFKNFHWIDFVMHAEADEAKVIIHGNAKTFSSKIAIKPLYLSDKPNEKAFGIYLDKIQVLNAQGDTQLSEAIASQTLQPKMSDTSSVSADNEPVDDAFTPDEQESALPDFSDLQSQPLEAAPIIEDAADTMADISVDQNENYVSSDVVDDPYAPSSDDFDIDLNDLLADEEPSTEHEESVQEMPPQETLDVEQESITIDMDLNDDLMATDEEEEEIKESKPMLGDYINASTEGLNIDPNYRYDPSIAADELGLPVDLIEEFIGDFIAQAHEFKEELFAANDNSDIDQVRILSHKLKGVAANLRIEDAFEILSTVNTSDDHDEIDKNLQYLYTIIARLEGKEEVQPETAEPVASTPDLSETEPETPPTEIISDSDDDLYDLGLPTASNESDTLIVEPTTNEAPIEKESLDISLDFDLDDEPKSEPNISTSPEEKEFADLSLDDLLPENESFMTDDVSSNENITVATDDDSYLDDGSVELAPMPSLDDVDKMFADDDEPLASTNVEEEEILPPMPELDSVDSLLLDENEAPQKNSEPEPEIEPEVLNEIPLDDDLLDIGIKQPDDEPLIVSDEPSITPEESPVLSVEHESIPTASAAVVLQKDIQKQSAELGIDTALFNELANDLKLEAQQRKEDLDSAIETQDTAQIKEILYEIKGAADNLRFNQISESITGIISSNDSSKQRQEETNLFALLEQL